MRARLSPRLLVRALRVLVACLVVGFATVPAAPALACVDVAARTAEASEPARSAPATVATVRPPARRSHMAARREVPFPGASRALVVHERLYVRHATLLL